MKRKQKPRTPTENEIAQAFELYKDDFRNATDEQKDLLCDYMGRTPENIRAFEAMKYRTAQMLLDIYEGSPTSGADEIPEVPFKAPKSAAALKEIGWLLLAFVGLMFLIVCAGAWMTNDIYSTEKIVMSLLLFLPAFAIAVAIAELLFGLADIVKCTAYTAWKNGMR